MAWTLMIGTIRIPADSLAKTWPELLDKKEIFVPARQDHPWVLFRIVFVSAGNVAHIEVEVGEPAG